MLFTVYFFINCTDKIYAYRKEKEKEEISSLELLGH